MGLFAMSSGETPIDRAIRKQVAVSQFLQLTIMWVYKFSGENKERSP
jgi:hypothetical protein